MNKSTVIALLAAKAALGASLAAGFLLSPAAPAHPAAADPTRTVTVDGADVPLCSVEDCSDIPASAQPGVWVDPDTGNAFLMWTDGPTFRVTNQPTK